MQRLQPHQHASGRLILGWRGGDVLGDRMDIEHEPRDISDRQS